MNGMTFTFDPSLPPGVCRTRITDPFFGETICAAFGRRDTCGHCHGTAECASLPYAHCAGCAQPFNPLFSRTLVEELPCLICARPIGAWHDVRLHYAYFWICIHIVIRDRVAC